MKAGKSLEINSSEGKMDKKLQRIIEIPSNSVTLQSGISNRHSRTKGSTINGNVYNMIKLPIVVNSLIRQFTNKVIKSSKLSILIFIFIMLLSYNVTALGITPGRSTFEYNAGEEKKVDFTIVNTEKKEMNLVVLIEGEFNESIGLSENSLKMNANEESKALSFIFRMPSGLTPGLHESKIVVLQLPEKTSSGGAFVGSVVGVATQVHVNVPYPGKYLEGEVNIVQDENGKIIFAIPVTNRGDLDLTRVKGNIDVYSSLNEKVVSVNTNEISLLSKERKELVSELDTSNMKVGPYRAVVSVLYDEKVLSLEKEFNVGAKKLNVEDIAVNDFSLGEIAKFEILVENKWSEKIKDVYAEMVVYNKEGAKMAEFKSANYDVDSLSKTLIVAFWDTDGVKKGSYDSSLYLKYLQNSEQRDLKLEVSDKSIDVIGFGYTLRAKNGKDEGVLSTANVLIGIVVLLIIINLSWFMFLRKRFMKKGK